MPIKRTAGGGYEVSVCVNYQRAHRRLPAGTTQSHAKLIEAELRRSLARHRSPSIPGDPLLVDVMAGYIRHCDTLRSPATAKHHAMRAWKWLEGHRASDARIVGNKIITDMRGHYAAATINRSLAALKKGLHLAWDTGATPINYSSLVKSLPVHNARTTTLTMDQVAALANNASPTVCAAIWISLFTGMRRGEICKLQRHDIGASEITIQAGNTKTLRTRTVPIIAPVRPWLKHIPLAVTFEGVKSGFRRAREAAGLPTVTFHDLRRSCGSLMVNMGVDLYTVSGILGHSSVKVTEQVYAHLGNAKRRAGLDTLATLHQDLHQPSRKTRRKG
jgi:integrase